MCYCYTSGTRKKMARLVGFEPTISCSTGRRIRPLFYNRIWGVSSDLPRTLHLHRMTCFYYTTNTIKTKTGALCEICAHFSRLQDACITNNALRAWYRDKELNPDFFVRSEESYSLDDLCMWLRIEELNFLY